MAFDISKFKKNADVSKAAEGLAKAKESVGQDLGGTGWASVLDVSKVPYSAKWWKPTQGTHYIDIVGTLVTNPRNPSVRNGSIGVGDYDFGLTVWVHPDSKGGGPKGLPHVCLKRNGLANSCPRCEEYFRKKEDGGSWVKGVKGSGNTVHRTSERTFMIVVPRENLKTPGTQAFLWDASVHSFTSELLEEANALSGGGQPTFFWWPTDQGKTVQFDAVPSDLDKAFDFKRIKFHDRPESVGTALYEKWSFPLDEILIIPTAQQMQDDMDGAPTAEDAPEEESRQRSTYHREEQDAPDTQETRTQHPAQPEHPVEDGKWAKPEKAEPAKAEAPKQEPVDQGDTCPHGYTWGVTPIEDEQKECARCPKFDRCVG